MIHFLVPMYKRGIALLLLLLIAIPGTSHALCDATLQWDANTPAPDGYLVFGRLEGQAYDYDDPWWSGDYTFNQCAIEELDENTTYYFVVRAYVGENVSGDSNEARFSYAASDTTSDTSSDSSSSLTNDTNAISPSSSGGGSGGCFIQSLWGFASN